MILIKRGIYRGNLTFSVRIIGIISTYYKQRHIDIYRDRNAKRALLIPIPIIKFPD